MPDPPEKDTTGRWVNQLVRGLDLDAASDEEVNALAEQVVGMGREAVEHLARSALRRRPPLREKVAALLACLRGEQALWALTELEELLDRRRLTPMERVWLLATLRRLEEAASPAGGEAHLDGYDGEEPEEPLADETQLLLWRDELASLAPSEQEAALAPIVHSGDPGLIPLLEMALSLRKPRLDAAVAAGLAHFASPAVLPLLRELLQRADPAVRKRAREALPALERQGVDTREVFVAVAETDEPVAAAYATRPDTSGRMAVLVSRGHAPGRVRYAAVLLDAIEAGVARAWGESGLTEADLLDRIGELAEDIGQQLLPIDANTAQALVAAAEDYSRQQGHELPADYLVWRRCIGRPTRPEQLPMTFGPSCSECGVPVSGGDIDRGGLVAGQVALCALCATQPRNCALCGRPLHSMFDYFVVRKGSRGGKVEFVCMRCARRGKAGEQKR